MGDNSPLTIDEHGAVLTISNKDQAPLIKSNKYLFFGKVDVTVKAAPGVGIVTSVVLESDDRDEIDWVRWTFLSFFFFFFPSLFRISISRSSPRQFGSSLAPFFQGQNLNANVGSGTKRSSGGWGRCRSLMKFPIANQEPHRNGSAASQATSKPTSSPKA